MKNGLSYKLEAVVLKARDIKETDRVYTIFSKEKGKLNVVGIGIRKPTAKLAGGVDPVTFSELFLIKSRWLDKLTGTIIIDQFPLIKKNEKKLVATRKMLDVLDRLSNEKEPQPEIWDGLQFVLGLVEHTRPERAEVWQLARLGLVWKLIKASGFQPSLLQCASCQAELPEKDYYWFNTAVGLECLACQSAGTGKRIRVSKNAVKVLRLFMSQRLGVIARIKVPPAEMTGLLRLTELVLSQILDRRISL